MRSSSDSPELPVAPGSLEAFVAVPLKGLMLDLFMFLTLTIKSIKIIIGNDGRY
jgi:hypothetical protein